MPVCVKYSGLHLREHLTTIVLRYFINVKVERSKQISQFKVKSQLFLQQHGYVCI